MYVRDWKSNRVKCKVLLTYWIRLLQGILFKSHGNHKVKVYSSCQTKTETIQSIHLKKTATHNQKHLERMKKRTKSLQNNQKAINKITTVSVSCQ
jgi:hypothetical protein